MPLEFVVGILFIAKAEKPSVLGRVLYGVHPGVLDIRGRRDFSRFDPSPGEAPL